MTEKRDEARPPTDGFELQSTIHCPCGDSFTWFGAGPDLVEWIDEHKQHLSTGRVHEGIRPDTTAGLCPECLEDVSAGDPHTDICSFWNDEEVISDYSLPGCSECSGTCGESCPCSCHHPIDANHTKVRPDLTDSRPVGQQWHVDMGGDERWCAVGPWRATRAEAFRDAERAEMVARKCVCPYLYEEEHVSTCPFAKDADQ